MFNRERERLESTYSHHVAKTDRLTPSERKGPSEKFLLSCRQKSSKRQKSRSLEATQTSVAPGPYVADLARTLLSLRNEDQRYRGNYRIMLIGKHLRTYAIALKLRASRDAWIAFCRLPDWEGFRGRPKPNDQRNAIRHAIRFACGFNGRNTTKRVSKYVLLLDPFFQNSVSVSALRTALTSKKEDAERKQVRPKNPKTASDRTTRTITMSKRAAKAFDTSPAGAVFRLNVEKAQSGGRASLTLLKGKREKKGSSDAL